MKQISKSCHRASSVTSSLAVMGGNITSDGGGTITARGVCWSLTTNPVVSPDTTIAELVFLTELL